MISDISLSDTLVGIEGVLKLDYSTQRNVEFTIKQAKKEIENAYGLTLDKPVYEIQIENQLSATNVDKFIDSLTIALQRLSLYTAIVFYTKKVPFALADVNFLGFARHNLITSLKYLLDDDLYSKERENIIPPLYSALDNVTVGFVKRLFVILLMLDNLGIYDGAAVVVQLLYLGGIN